MNLKENKKIIWRRTAAALSMSVLLITGIVYAASPYNIELNVDGEIHEISTKEKTIEGMLEENGIILNKGDFINYNTEELLSDVKEITIKRNKTIELVYNGETKTYNNVTSSTVKEFIKDFKIDVEGKDIVSPALDKKLNSSDKVEVLTIREELSTKEEEIEAPVETKYDFTMNYGEEKVEREGQAGTKTTVFLDTITGGDSKKSRQIDEKIKEPISRIVVKGSKKEVTEDIAFDTEHRKDNSMYSDKSKTIQAGQPGKVSKVLKIEGNKEEEISRKVIKQPVKKIVAKGTKSRPVSSSSTSKYSIRDLEFHGVINWSGYKFTYYSQNVLPGTGLRIPGRHVANGYVKDKDGYIVLASNPSIPRGTIINTPFGAKGKVYDRCASCTLNWYDVYTR